MTIKVTVPELGESVIGATIGEWHKQEGDTVAVGDVLVDLETDKVDIEVSAESAGVLVSINRQAGEDVEIGDTLAEIDETAVSQPTAEPSAKPESKPTPAAAEITSSEAQTTETAVTPVAQRLADEQGLDLAADSAGQRYKRPYHPARYRSSSATKGRRKRPLTRNRLPKRNQPLHQSPVPAMVAAKNGCACHAAAAPSPNAWLQPNKRPPCSPPSTMSI